MSGRPVRARLAPAGLRQHARAVLVLSGPVLDGTGDVIEHRLLALATSEWPGTLRPGAALLERCRLRLAAHLRRRIRRLQPIVAMAAARRLATEKAIALHLHTVSHPGDAQLGLFSQREATAFRDARERSAFRLSVTAGRLQMEEARGHLDTAYGIVEWIGGRA